MEYRKIKNENVDDVITKVGKVLGVKIEKEHIDACHRLRAIKGGETRGPSLSLLAGQRKKNNLQKGK